LEPFGMKVLTAYLTRHRFYSFVAALALLFLISASRAQQPAAAVQQSSEDRIALYQALLDLQNPWTVMCVAAHPDDEDGTSLIVMRHKYGAHTVSLFSTFGEGGQNAIGPELYEELGAIRARETMAAAEIQGSEPHFLGLKDFGFSKSRDEAFKFWGHDEALRRMVLQIRKLRPDVIITNHSTTSNDHGHHQATALMVVEAFDAAADPSKYPEQLKDGVTTWQVQRLFVRQRGNQAANSSTPIVTIDPNEQDPVRGTVFGEQALNGLQKHATQGPWPKSFAEYRNRFRAFSGQNAPTGQLPMIRYALVKTANTAAPMPAQESHNFLDGLLLTDDSVRQLTPLTISNPPLMAPDNAFALLNDKDAFAKLAALAKAFHQLHQPRITIPQTIHVREDLMDERLNVALALAAGIEVTLTSEADAVVPETPAKFVITIANHGSKDARLYGVGIHGMARGESRGTDTPLVLPGKSTRIVRTLEAPQTGNMTVPHAEHLYDGREFGEIFTATIRLSVQGNPVQIIRRIPVDVAPPVEITGISPQPLVVRPIEVGASSAGVDVIPAQFPKVTLQLINHLDQPFKGEIVYGRKNGEQEARDKVELLAHQTTTVALSLPNAPRTVAAHARASASPESFFIAVRTVGSNNKLTERRIPIVSANAHVAGNLRVGYIRGFDFSLPNALNALGVESKELSVDDVKTGDLSKFTSLIVDNRVYESKPELIAVNQRLLDYAQAGGNLIVFYHKSDEWNPDERRNRPQLAPYKLILGGERVTDENAPITFIEPDHPLLNTPNKMGQDDFKDWIQERGLYYPKEWDPQFHALLQSNDPGENPLKGGLLVADYGKGHYIYTSMVWYRELRGGIPGAYRMLANMISYGR
jgi:LmbE family N-acetylglucosaminyl deacetylase